MNILKLFRTLWGILDSFLLISILFMLTVLVLTPALSKLEEDKSNSADSQIVNKESNSVRDLRRNRSALTVEPVAYERNKSAQIARNMIVSESVNLPLRPALDMREKDKLYEVRFSMPQESDESDVNIELNGNILTMVLDAEDKTFMKRIRIPCDYAHDSVLKHFVSNQVLHVQITKSDQ